MWDVPKCFAFGPFWDLIYSRKSNNITKTKISAPTTSLGLSNNKFPDPRKNHRILVKLSKKTPIFWAKNGPKLSPGARSRGHKKFSHCLS